MKRLLFVLFFIICISPNLSYAFTFYDISGTWKGYVSTGEEYAKVTVEMEQYEDGTIVGKWKNSAGGRGSLGGRLKGRYLKFKLNNKSGCSGTYSGEGRLSKDGTQIRYTVSGSDCTGSVSGNGKLYYRD